VVVFVVVDVFVLVAVLVEVVLVVVLLVVVVVEVLVVVVAAPGVVDCEVALVTTTELTATELAPAEVSSSLNTCMKSCLNVSTLLVSALTLAPTASALSGGTSNS